MVQRYDPSVFMTKADDGDYVDYEDYKKFKNALKKIRKVEVYNVEGNPYAALGLCKDIALDALKEA